MTGTERATTKLNPGFVPTASPEFPGPVNGYPRYAASYDYVQLRMLEATKCAFAAPTSGERKRAEAEARRWNCVLWQLEQSP